MKILHIVSALDPRSGGPTRSVKGLCRAIGRGYYAQGAAAKQQLVKSEQLAVNSEQLAVNSGEHQGEAGECSAYRLPFTVYQTGTRPSTCFGRSGWWVEVSVEALAQALDEAMGMSDAQRAAMGMNGRKLVFERFRWEVVAAEMENLYNGALNTDSRQVFCKLQS